MHEGRIEATKVLWGSGKVKHFADLFRIHPHTPVARYMHTDPQRLQRLSQEPWRFRIDELVLIAKYFGISPEDLVLFALRAMPKK